MPTMSSNVPDLTTRIHELLMSHAISNIPGYETAVAFQPAKDWSGDFFYGKKSKGDNFALGIGDIVDKGLVAANYMSKAYEVFDAGLNQDKIWQARGISKWFNTKLHEHEFQVSETGEPHMMYLTMLFGFLNTKYHTFRYFRGGHERPYIMDVDGNFLHNGAGIGQPLGLFKNPIIETGCLKIPLGGMLVMYTDGVYDETDKHHVHFGQKRLEKLIRANRNNSAQYICQVLVNKLKEYRDQTARADDSTILILKRTK